MNKTYRSIWNESTGTWVAVQENAASRSKRSSKPIVLATGAMGVATSLLSAHAFSATAGTVGQGGLEICSGTSGYSWGSSGGSQALNCSSGSSGTSDGLAFSLNNAGDTKGGYGFDASTAQVAGYQNGLLNIKGTDVQVYGPTTFHNVVTMSNQKIVELAPGEISAASADAVNGSQLYGSISSVAKNFGGGAAIGPDGSISAPSYVLSGSTYNDVGSALAALGDGGADKNAVHYDSSANTSVTLGGVGSTTPVALHNVANGVVSANSTDAVNGAQLNDVSTSVTNVNNSVNKIQNTLTTAGWGAQATSSDPTGYTYGGFNVAADGTVSNPAVLYVPNTIGTANAQIVLDPGKGNSQYFVNGNPSEGYLPKGTVISNVAEGVQQTDAANVGQVYDIVAAAGGGGGLRTNGLLRSGTRLMASSGSGVDPSQANSLYATAAYYSQVRGMVNSSGSTPPSDVARAIGQGSIAIGSNTEANANNSSAMGIQSLASAPDTVALGSGSVANVANTVSVGSDGTATRTVINADRTTTTVQSQANTRRVVNMAAGQGDTDAVNVSQLKGVTAALGGGTAVNADGSIHAPSYNVAGGSYTDVGSALAAVDNASAAGLADAVKYDSSAHNSVTFGGVGSTVPVALHNVANGAVNLTSLDAVNGSQLFGLANSTAAALGGNTTVNPNGSISAPSYALGDTGTFSDVGSALDAINTKAESGSVNGVVYDTDAHDTVTFGGAGKGHAPVKLTNVANGTVTAASSDAVNGAQLYALGATTDSSGNVTNAFVAYDDTTKSKITLGGKGATTPTALTNVANGQLNATSTDAVNGAQLFATNQNVSDLAGDVTNIAGDVTNLNAKVKDAVLYDSSAHDSVTFGTAGKAVALHNVANGAVNLTSLDAVNGSQLFGLANSTAAALGGNTTVNPNGSISAPSYVLNNAGTYTDVGSALEAINAKADSGSVNGVVYDTDAHDTVTFGGAGKGHAPVKLTNVANGTVTAASSDAVNGAQLYALGATTDSSGNVTNAFVAYDDTTKSKITLGGKGATTPTALTNVANGQLNATSTDAVNGAQLFATNQNVSDLAGDVTNIAGDVTNLNAKVKDAVLYDSSAHDSVTFGGVGSTVPVALHNVANGAVSLTSLDAVNGSQLYGLASSTAAALGGNTTVNPNGSISAPSYVLNNAGTYTNVGDALEAINAKADSGSVNGVVYDTDAHDTVTFGGAGKGHAPVKLTNVANGTVTAASSDAVNGAQLYALGATTDSSGNVTNAFVAYDDTTKSKITLGGKGATTPTALTNVANGQLNATSTDAVNGAQLFATNQNVSDLAGDVTNIAGDVTNLNAKVKDAVLYDSSAHDSVTFGGVGSTVPVALHNVANGAVNLTSLDAVNGSQLFGLANSTAAALGGNTTVNPNGSITAPTYAVGSGTYNDVGSALDAIAALAGSGDVNGVVYDSSAHDKITLGGKNSTSGPVKVTNLANASEASDAVNLAQLEAMGMTVDTSGNVTNAFVAYDDTSKSSITLGGKGSTTPVAIHNVANGVAANDAVNIAQLQAMGAIVDSSGNVTNSFVAYDDATKGSVTFGGLGATAPVKLHNVAAGAVTSSSTDAINGAQLYNVASSTADALGGGSTVNADGSISAPTYVISGGTYTNVGGALTNLDGRVTNIENTVTNIAGSVANAVQYDSSAHDKITLGGTDASTAVKLTNLQDGELSASSTDAVTGAQLYATNVEVSNLNQAIQNININGSEYMSTNSTSGPASATGSNSIAAGGGATATGANSTAMGDKAKATADNSVALGANSVADQANTVSVGSAGNERRITNVAAGVNPTDAVNMGQFQNGMNSLQSGLNSVARNAYGGVAAATALTMIPDVDQGKTIAVGVGTANFQGYQAAAIGATARITQNIKVKLGGGYAASGGATYGAGMSYQW